jgi:DNA-binding XRE family transcriptional regulator
VYPAWAFQPRLATYLGYDPFTNPRLGSPNRNEPSGVAILSPEAPVSIGQQIKQFRLKSRKSRKQFASELGVSTKTLWGWETNRWQPSDLLKKRVGADLTT